MIGVLSLQGDFAEHLRALNEAGEVGCLVKTKQDLERCSGLIVPGGESTTIGKLLKLTELDGAVKEKYTKGELKVWGTCAGAILCSSEGVLGLEDYQVERNAYGGQLSSFEADLGLRVERDLEFRVKVAFIRAPKIVKVGQRGVILSKVNEEVVFALFGERLLVSSCHPELYAEENREFYKWLIAWFGA